MNENQRKYLTSRNGKIQEQAFKYAVHSVLTGEENVSLWKQLVKLDSFCWRRAVRAVMSKKNCNNQMFERFLDLMKGVPNNQLVFGTMLDLFEQNCTFWEKCEAMVQNYPLAEECRISILLKFAAENHSFDEIIDCR